METTTTAHAPRSRSSKLPQLRKHATGQWRLRLSGRDYYLGIDKKAAQREANRLIAEWISTNRTVPPRREDEKRAEGTTIDEVVVEYVRRELPKRSPTMQDRIKRALRPLQDRFGDTPADAFDARRLDDVRREFVTTGMTRIEINARVGMVRSLFTWGAGLRLVDPGVAFALSSLRGLRYGQGGREQREILPIDWPTVEATLRHVAEPVAGLILFQWHTGARPGEACAVTAEDIDRSGRVWVYRPKHHKTQRFGKRRSIPIAKTLQAMLAPVLLRRPGGVPLFAPADSIAEQKRVAAAQRRSEVQPSQRARARRRARHPKRALREAYCVNAYRRAIERGVNAANMDHRRARLVELLVPLASSDATREGVNDAVARVPVAASARAVGRLVDRLTNAGVEPELGKEIVARVLKEPGRFETWHPHRLRHAFAHRAEGETGDLDGVRAALGHASDAMTRRYAHADERRAIALAERLG